MSLFKIVRFVGLTVATFLLLFAIGVIAFTLTISPDTIRTQVEKALSTNGRTVTITGPVDIALLPNITLSFEGFRMTEGGTEEVASLGQIDSVGASAQTPVVTIAKGVAKLKLLPLFTGTAEFDSVDVTGLTVHPANKTMQNAIAFTCNVSAKGQAHYDFAQYDTATGFTPDAIKRAIASKTQINMTDIRLLDKDLVTKLSRTFGANYFEQFQLLSATVTTQDGTVRSDDIKLVGKHVNATGNGTVNLINNALAAAFNINIDGFETIPVNIKGTTQAPIYTVESAAAANLLMKGLQGLGVKIPNNQNEGSTGFNGLGDIDPQKVIEGFGNFLNKLGL